MFLGLPQSTRLRTPARAPQPQNSLRVLEHVFSLEYTVALREPPPRNVKGLGDSNSILCSTHPPPEARAACTEEERHRSQVFRGAPYMSRLLQVLLPWLRSVSLCAAGWGAEKPLVLHTWEDVRATIADAENGSWDALPTQFPKVTFKMLLDALVPDTTSRNRFVVNVGARDGKLPDPTFPLFMEGYAGLAIEADPQWQDTLHNNLAAVNSSAAIHTVMERVQPHSVISLLEKFSTPVDFDCLKIDIDSIDLAILQSVLRSGFSPKVVMIEINPDIPPPFQLNLEFHPQCECNWKHGAYGASADAIFRVASGHGYSLVAFEALDPEIWVL